MAFADERQLRWVMQADGGLLVQQRPVAPFLAEFAAAEITRAEHLAADAHAGLLTQLRATQPLTLAGTVRLVNDRLQEFLIRIRM